MEGQPVRRVEQSGRDFAFLIVEIGVSVAAADRGKEARQRQVKERQRHGRGRGLHQRCPAQIHFLRRTVTVQARMQRFVGAP